jgi:hypothetical protein
MVTPTAGTSIVAGMGIMSIAKCTCPGVATTTITTTNTDPTAVTITIIVTGDAHESKGTSVRAIIQQGGKTTTLDLADQDDKKLVATLPAPLALRQ